MPENPPFRNQTRLEHIQKTYKITNLALIQAAQTSGNTLSAIRNYHRCPEPSTRERIVKGLNTLGAPVSETDIWPHLAQLPAQEQPAKPSA